MAHFQLFRSKSMAGKLRSIPSSDKAQPNQILIKKHDIYNHFGHENLTTIFILQG